MDGPPAPPEAHWAEPADQLLGAVALVLEPWLVRCVEQAATAQLGRAPESLLDAARQRAAQDGPAVMERLEALLAADVDEQRTNPLSVLRAAVAGPTAVLAGAGVPPAPRDGFQERAFPDDPYGLSPATWSDVDPTLHEPGLMWGAWKASVVLARRRAEGRR